MQYHVGCYWCQQQKLLINLTKDAPNFYGEIFKIQFYLQKNELLWNLPSSTNN